MKLFVGLITYRESSLKYLKESLASLSDSLSFLSKNDYSVVIFDNSGSDYHNNLDFIAEHYPEFKVITKDKNLGFAKAYNIMIRRARDEGAKYFLMINPDVLFEKNSINKLVSALDSSKEFSSVCPEIYHWPFPQKPSDKEKIDTFGLVLLSGLHFVDLGQGRENDGSFDDLEILGPSGAAGLFRMSSLEKVAMRVNGEEQYFDERMFMYKEDCDLAYRLSQAGMRSLCVKGAVIWHDRTVADAGKGFLAAVKDRKNKSKQVRSWSFVNQHLIYYKYFKKQGLISQIKILGKLILMFLFALTKERFLLLEYRNILTKIRKK